MTQSITVTPSEEGTAVVTITATDEDDTTLVFSDLTDPQWQLMRGSGSIVNSNTFANSNLSSLEWVLTGDDLVIFGSSDDGERVISFQATYDSTAGNNLPLKGECSFYIDKLLGQKI